MASILICDDAAFMRQTLIQILRKTDYTVVAEAENGLDCIEKYEVYKPDVVLMDITMPDMDGIEATQKIIAMDKNAKIIIVSAMGQQAMVFSAITSGAKDFIVKPFDPERIIECINKYA